MKLSSHQSGLIALITIMIFIVQPTASQTNRAKVTPLSIGMTSAQVLMAWGVPDQKTVRETRRQERWDYGKRQVLFQNGAVTRWRTEDEDSVGTTNSKIPMGSNNDPTASRNSKDKTAPLANETDSHLLDSILKELPKDGGSESTAAANNAMPPKVADVVTEEEEP